MEKLIGGEIKINEHHGGNFCKRILIVVACHTRTQHFT